MTESEGNRWLKIVCVLVGVAIGLGISSVFALAEFRVTKSNEWLETFNVALGTFIGFLLSAIITWYSMQKGKEDLSNMSSALGHQILNIEDVTRKLLEDFPEIFSVAFEMLDKAHKRLWILNFTPCFGYVHAFNKRFIEEYAAIKNFPSKAVDEQHKFLEERVRRFYGKIELEADFLEDFRLATIHPDDFAEKFMEPVFAKVNNPDAWFLDTAPIKGSVTDNIREIVRKQHASTTSNIEAKLSNKYRQSKTVSQDRVVFLNKVPLQMLIADKGDKDTCLVFFIGTDNITSEHEIKGFYTEFPDLVKLFKGIFDGIVRDHDKKRHPEKASALHEVERVSHAPIPRSH